MPTARPLTRGISRCGCENSRNSIVPGIFHVANAGDGVSFEQFAREAVLMAGYLDGDVEGIQMDSLKRPAPRPRNSRLRSLNSEAAGLSPLPGWLDSLKNFVRERV